MSITRGLPELRIVNSCQTRKDNSKSKVISIDGTDATFPSQPDYLETLTEEHQIEILLAQLRLAERALITGVAILNGSDYRSMMFTLDKYPLKVCDFMIATIKDSIPKNLQKDIPYAEVCLGLIYEKRNDLATAHRYFESAERKNCTEAMFRKVLLMLRHPGLVNNPVEQGYALTHLAIADFVKQENFDGLIRMAQAFKNVETEILARPTLDPYMPENAQKYKSELEMIDAQFVAILKSIPADAIVSMGNALIFADLMQRQEKKFIPHGIVPQVHTDVLEKVVMILEAAKVDESVVEQIQIRISKRLVNQERQLHGIFKAPGDVTQQQTDLSVHTPGMGSQTNG